MIAKAIKILLLIKICSLSNLYAQNDCEKISMTSTSLLIDTLQCPINKKKDGDFYDTLYLDKKCHENYIEITCTQRNCWNYLIEDYIYVKENGTYRQICKFITESTRQYYAIFGRLESEKTLKEICFDTSVNKNEFLLTETFDIQTEEKTKKYYNEILCSNKNKPEILKMLAVAFILDKEFITDNNVELVYELANCLYENKCYQYSLQVFQKINSTMHYPDDTRTCLGIGDNYWMIGNKSLAKTYYENYVMLMEWAGKTNEIPKRVLKRIQ